MRKDKCAQLAALISDIFEQGLEITPDVIFFADSTYGMSSRELQDALADPDFDEIDTFMDLIFHPDEKARLGIEQMLCELGFEKDDEKMIANQIFSNCNMVPLFFDGRSRTFKFPVTRELVSNYISRLYIDRKNEDAVEALHANLPEQTALSASVRLRCLRRQLPERTNSFLCFFIARAKKRSVDFPELFELLLNLLGDMPENENIEAYLLLCRSRIKKMVEDIVQFEKKKNQYSMEYLMMQKYQVPHESEEVMSDRLRLINIIINDVLGIISRPQPSVGQEDLGSFNSSVDMEKLIRTLS